MRSNYGSSFQEEHILGHVHVSFLFNFTEFILKYVLNEHLIFITIKQHI